MKRIFPYLKPYLWAMSLGLTIKFVGTIMDLLLPWLLSYLIDTVVPMRSIPMVLFYGGVMVICSIVAVITNIQANRMASRVARDVTRTVRHDLFQKISLLSCRQVDAFTIPSLESRLTSDTYNIHQVVGRMQRLGIRAPILLLGGIVVTLTLEPVLTLVLLAILPVLGFVVYKISQKGIPLYTRLQQAVDKMVLDVRENAGGIRVIKALSKMDYEKEQFSQVNAEVTKRETTAATVMAASNPLMNLFLNLGLTLVIVVGAYRVNSGLTQPGKIIAFLTYFTIILNAMLSITRMFIMYSKGSASAVRIGEVLDTPEDLTVLPEDKIETPYHITFNDVCFSYNKTQNNLENISFALKKGETLGILGATGCGKTTVINLLIRFYDVDSGEIRINGQNVNSIPFQQLHQKFGIVFQNDVLFADTISENIAFGRALHSSAIEAAARYAQASGFIDQLEDGLEHPLTARGTNLSGGQKQRVLISRALAAQPEILVLDDSSSALDYKTDAQLRQAIGEHFQKTTTIIVAQRISSVMQADHIMVLEEGRILGYGTHSQLMESCASYREIAKSQMGGGAANEQ